MHLHERQVPEQTEQVLTTWHQILADPNHHVIVYDEGGQLAASCVCLIVPNLTRGVRSYALVENVVTHSHFRRRGFASACLQYAVTLAREAGCYKVMLMTGSRDEQVLHFYEKNGFSAGEKTAFLQRL